MSYSKEWDNIYELGQQFTEWPFSDIVSLTCRHLGKSLSGMQILELGCGPGPNIQFFLKAGAVYYALEGSSHAVGHIHSLYPQLVGTVVRYDFSDTWPFDNSFDLVVDRSAVTHNSESAIVKVLAQIKANLRPGGYYIGIDWHGVEHSDRHYGRICDDPNTYCDFTKGQFQECGKVHFSDERHIRDLLQSFEIVYLEDRKAIIVQESSSPQRIRHTYNFVARMHI